MDADLEPGLAWMVIATEEGGMHRIHDGKLLGFSKGVVSLDPAFVFPFFAGGIFQFSDNRYRRFASTKDTLLAYLKRCRFRSD